MHIFALRRHALRLCLIPFLAAGCGSSVPSDSSCRNLVYKEEGLTRTEYLPCAGEIVAALDELERQSEAAARGDGSARSGGRATMARVRALMNAAGGRNLLERWDDRALMHLNMSISNAMTHYEAFYMVRVLEEPNQFAAQTREAAEVELRAAIRRHEEARSSYRRLR